MGDVKPVPDAPIPKSRARRGRVLTEDSCFQIMEMGTRTRGRKSEKEGDFW